MRAFAAGLLLVLEMTDTSFEAENFKPFNNLMLDFRSSMDGVPSARARLGAERRI
jgi:hypothetical protein